MNNWLKYSFEILLNFKYIDIFFLLELFGVWGLGFGEEAKPPACCEV